MADLYRWRITLPGLPRGPWTYGTIAPSWTRRDAGELPEGARIEVEQFQRIGRTVREG